MAFGPGCPAISVPPRSRSPRSARPARRSCATGSRRAPRGRSRRRATYSSGWPQTRPRGRRRRCRIGAHVAASERVGRDEIAEPRPAEGHDRDAAGRLASRSCIPTIASIVARDAADVPASRRRRPKTTSGAGQAGRRPRRALGEPGHDRLKSLCRGSPLEGAVDERSRPAREPGGAPATASRRRCREPAVLDDERAARRCEPSRKSMAPVIVGPRVGLTRRPVEADVRKSPLLLQPRPMWRGRSGSVLCTSRQRSSSSVEPSEPAARTTTFCASTFSPARARRPRSVRTWTR